LHRKVSYFVSQSFYPCKPRVNGFWLEGSTLIGPNAQSGGAVAFWHYPAGGAPSKTMRQFLEPTGV